MFPLDSILGIMLKLSADELLLGAIVIVPSVIDQVR